jgi:hypothetical protein
VLDLMIRPAMMDACVPPEPMQRLLDVLPWIGGVLLVSLAVGVVITCLSLCAGDKCWEAIRHGITAAVTSAGPLITMTVFLFTLLDPCV